MTDRLRFTASMSGSNGGYSGPSSWSWSFKSSRTGCVLGGADLNNAIAWLIKDGYNPDGSDPRTPSARKPAPGDLIRCTSPNGRSRVFDLRAEPSFGSHLFPVGYDACSAAVLAAVPCDDDCGNVGRWLFVFVASLPYGMGLVLVRGR